MCRPNLDESQGSDVVCGRPLELATLRLQTMLGVSLANWDELQPVDDRCLTQLGGLVRRGQGRVGEEMEM